MTFKNYMPYTEGEKRYHTLSYDLNHRFGGRVWKAAVDAGFTCPNRDGTKGRNGCSFCAGGSGDFTPASLLTPAEQIRMEQQRIWHKWPEAQVIAYFQAYSNTYAPLEKLRSVFEPVVGLPGVCGISIGTRPDCLPVDILDYLQELSHRIDLTVELGLQTVHDQTAECFGRGDGMKTFVNSFEQLKHRGIRTCVHFINGLPGEDADAMVESAKQIGLLQPDGVKIHALQVLEGTSLAEQWKRGEIQLLSKEAYIDIVCRQLEQLPPETVIERLTGDGDKRFLLAPNWRCGKITVLAGIDKILKERNSWQGKEYFENHQLE